MHKKDLTGTATAEDFGVDPELFFQPDKGVEDKAYSLRGGYIREFQFDPSGYQLPADYLEKQDKLKEVVDQREPNGIVVQALELSRCFERLGKAFRTQAKQ